MPACIAAALPGCDPAHGAAQLDRRSHGRDNDWMKWLRVLGCILAAVATLAAAEREPPDADRIWLAPAPGSLDYLRLFQAPSEWARARHAMGVFKFYQQHTLDSPPSIVGPNSYDALARANAFRLLSRSWGKKIAIEVGAVKEFYCTPGPDGMRDAVAATVASMNAVQRAGGSVAYLAMDEPFLSGLSARCGGPSLDPTANRLAVYVRGVKATFPDVRIGLIEAYPTFDVDAFESMIRLMRERNIPPAFVHADVDLRAMKPARDDFARDMSRLAAICVEEEIPFGVIIWGENGNADALFAAEALQLAGAVETTFGRSTVMPSQVIFQSWAESASGLRITPTNLPETRADTLTELLLRVFRRLRTTDPSRERDR